MKTSARRGLAAGFALAATAAGLSGCSSDDSSGSTSASAAPVPSAAAAAQPVGAGCADYAKAVPTGAGSVAGMSQAPVATAASNNPMLKTLVAAVSGKVNPKVNLTKTLNSGEFTVFAPVDAAFVKVSAAQQKLYAKDSDALTKVLTYHVIAGQLSPDDVVGTQTTMEGATVKVTGSAANLKVNGIPVICGGVHTANATVYLIGGVLTPPK